MAVSDIFPLTPNYPLERRLVDRKVRVRMESGKQYVRSRGTDLNSFELVGLGTSADKTTLHNFYEQQAKDVFTFQDKSFSPQVDRVVVFAAPPEWAEAAFEAFYWRCTLIETTQA